MTQVNPIVVEFGRGDLRNDYIVGPTLDDILANTSNGASFGGTEYTSYRPLTKREVSKLKLRNYRAGCDAVMQRGLVFFLETR